MPLSKDQQAELERLQAEAVKPEPRTDTGLAGVLHTVLDVASGVVAHLPKGEWAALHSTVEQELGDKRAQAGESSSGKDSSDTSSSGKGKASS